MDNPAVEMKSSGGSPTQQVNYGGQQGAPPLHPQQNNNQSYPNNLSAIPIQPGNTPITSTGTTFIIQQPVAQYNMSGHIVFSCVVFWCFNCILGGIAFLMSLTGQNLPVPEARKKANIALILNIVGFVTGIILWSFVGGLYFSGELR